MIDWWIHTVEADKSATARPCGPWRVTGDDVAGAAFARADWRLAVEVLGHFDRDHSESRTRGRASGRLPFC